VTSSPQKERRQLYPALKDEIPELTVLSLRGRDDEPAETVGSDLVDKSTAADEHFHPRRWRRRYIESYLICPPAIASASGLSEDDVRKRLSEKHGIAVGEKFAASEPPQALLDVRAKSILRDKDAPAVVDQFDVDPLDVAKSFDAAAIPEDIKTFLNDVVSLV
jgi:hypothetical protein